MPGLPQRADMPSWPPVRHPHQVFLMGASVLAGAVGLLAGSTSGSVSDLLPPVLLVVWQATLMACGSLGLAAAVLCRRDAVLSLLMERIALGGIGAFALLYGVVVPATVGIEGVFVGAITGGYGLACLVRFAQVHQVLAWLNRIVDEERGQ